MFSITNVAYLNNGPYSLSLEAGEVAGITGKSGIGKSQFLRSLADVVSHQGHVFLKGVEMNEFAAPLWRQRVAMVPAEPVWWHVYAGDHFDQKIDDEKERLALLITKCGFEPTVLSWQVNRLSSGEKQRLGLIRALMQQPSILLLDEPTASLDAQSSDLIEQLISEYIQEEERAAVLVSHDADQLVRLSTTVYEMKKDALLQQKNGKGL